MRLIDADALAEEIEKNMENGFPANENLSLYAISCLAHAPTVDVLDDIRAEIKSESEMFKLIDRQMANCFDRALQIIDKHIKAEGSE